MRWRSRRWRAGDARSGGGCTAAIERDRSRRCARLHAVVRERPAGEGLEEEEYRHDREEEPGSPLARRELPVDEPVVVPVSRALLASPPEIVELAEREQNEPERAEQRDQAESAPQIRRRGRHVARPRFVRPVVRVRVVLARAVGHRCPARPREVGPQRRELLGVSDVGAREAGGRIVAREVVAPLAPLRLEGDDLARGEAECVARGIITIGLECAPNLLGDLQGRTALERGIRGPVPLAREGVARDLCQTVEVLRGVVGSEVGPVSPERAVLHQAVLEKHLLPAQDVVAGEDRRP
jgi:hypothetical protein